ncbi:hypothetical protein EUGRSUZ_H03473 [Eucalyptus grandis]|uniref:Uncharacterized protein n=2 Tax=Eucalyptus grandis TaxID=71139 RepID=A0A059B3Z1_EUCGR|nr:hypothetical protein EUGRSUZ_H03473 [Eucalyptus grandis]
MLTGQPSRRRGWSGWEKQTLGAWLACLSNFIVIFRWVKLKGQMTILHKPWFEVLTYLDNVGDSSDFIQKGLSKLLRCLFQLEQSH